MAKVKTAEGGRYKFECPGCGDNHTIPTAPGWEFNGNTDRPSFLPSLLVKTGRYSSHYKLGDACWCTYNADHPDAPAPFVCYLCHSYVQDGQIQFLTDCTHALAGQTVELKEIE